MSRRRGFTLVELLVVIGIIALLLALLLPSLNRAKQQALSLKCKAQMKQVGDLLRMYSDEYRGVLFPIGPEIMVGTKRQWQTLGYEPNMPDLGRSVRWPVPVFNIEDEYTKGTYDKMVPITQLKVTNPDILKCPVEQDPTEDHSYILNKYLAIDVEKSIKWGGTVLDADGNKRSYSDVVLMGEKRTSEPDYYMEFKNDTEFDRVVEPYRHGLKLGSNYLYLDYHVDITPPKEVKDSLDPWDIKGSAKDPTVTP